MVSPLGQPVLRVDGVDKSTGRLSFVCDTDNSNSLVGKIYRSPIPYGKLLRLDLENARQTPGVHLVVGHADVPGHRYNPIYNQQNPHADLQVKDEVILDNVARYIGQPIAMVVADTEEQAFEGMSRIETEWEESPGVFDLESALQQGAPEVRNGIRGNISLGLRKPDEPISLEKGEVDKGFAQADEVFEDVFETQRVNQVALEPHLVCCWPEVGNRLAVLSTTQSIFGLRARLSESLGLPLSTFRVIRPSLGGAFGKGLDMISNEALCAFAALRLGRPVRIENTHQEEFTRTARHPSRMFVKTGVKKDGSLTARQMKAWMDIGASANHGPSVVMVGGSVFIGAYKTDHYLFEGFSVYTNNFPSGAMRGYGAVQTNYAVECHMDRIVCEMDFDPFEFRIQNAYRAGEISPLTDLPIRSSSLRECGMRARELIGWDNDASRTSHASNYKVGLGLAFCGMKNTGVHTGKKLPDKVIEFCGAIVKINEDGSVHLNVAAIEQGCGQATVLSQIVADVLGTSIDNVLVIPTDSDSAPFDAPTHASRITFAAGYSVRLAAMDAREKILEVAGHLLGEDSENLGVREERVYSLKSPDTFITLREVAEHYHYNQMRFILGMATSPPPGNPPAFGVQCVKVGVDVETGMVEILGMVDAHDIGRVINPLGATGQVEGGFAQGIGFALTEHLVIDKASGIVANAQFDGYKVPTALDVPKSQVEFLEPEGIDDLEVKGVSESTMNSPAAAIANAIHNAIGVRVRNLPITPEKILLALGKKMN